MSKKKEEQAKQDALQEEIRRVKMPRDKQTFAILESRLGGSRTRARCLDGKTRICRIPGRLKRKLWVREGDLVLVEPWELGGNEKGDVIFKYRSSAEVSFLRKKGYLKGIEEEF